MSLYPGTVWNVGAYANVAHLQCIHHKIGSLESEIAKIRQLVDSLSNAAHPQIICYQCAELRSRIEVLEAWRMQHSPCDRSSIGSEGPIIGSSSREEWSPVKGRTILDVVAPIQPGQSSVRATDEMEHLTGKVENLKFEIAKLATEIGKEKHHRKDLLDKVEQLTEMVRHSQAIVSSNRSQTEDERQIPHLQSQVGKMETALSSLVGQMERNQQSTAESLSELQIRLTSLEHAQRDMKQYVKKIEKAMKELQDTLALLETSGSAQSPAQHCTQKKNKAFNSSPKAQREVTNEVTIKFWQYVLFLLSHQNKQESQYTEWHHWIYEIGKSQASVEETNDTFIEAMEAMLQDRKSQEQPVFFGAIWEILGYLAEEGKYLVFQYSEGNCRKFWPILDRLNDNQKRNVLMAWRQKEGMNLLSSTLT